MTKEDATCSSEERKRERRPRARTCCRCVKHGVSSCTNCVCVVTGAPRGCASRAAPRISQPVGTAGMGSLSRWFCCGWACGACMWCVSVVRVCVCW